MRCNPSARWGPGTTKERQIDTEVSKELKQKMEKMLQEREKQNAMWTQSEEATKNVISSDAKNCSISSTTSFL
jgi:hypothetical protein